MKQVYSMYIHLLFQSGKSFILPPSLYPLNPQAVAVEPLSLKILAFEGFNFTALSLTDPQYQYLEPFVTKHTAPMHSRIKADCILAIYSKR